MFPLEQSAFPNVRKTSTEQVSLPDTGIVPYMSRHTLAYNACGPRRRDYHDRKHWYAESRAFDLNIFQQFSLQQPVCIRLGYYTVRIYRFSSILR
jgi:hypothetical protein